MQPPDNGLSDNVLSVTQLTEAVRHSLNGEFADVWVSGEISGLTRPQSGHIYLTLKDENAQLSAVIWRTAAQRIRFEPQPGTRVLCRGYLDVYPQRGTYQLIVEAIQPLGEGALQLAFRQLHDRLKAEGLFDMRHKKQMPAIPRRVVVITSPSGAAIHDFLQVVTRRWPHLDVLIVPVKVQGHGAADEIARALKMCGGRFAFEPDVIVVTRGGGSIEDLWAFNEEQVVRAIFDCPVPVVSAVGHEIDTTLCDLVADLRALTPSEAGEKLVPNVVEVRQLLAEVRVRIDRLVLEQYNRQRERLTTIASRPSLRQPLQTIQQRGQQLDAMDGKLHRLAEQRLKSVRQRLAHSLNVLSISAGKLIPGARLQLHQLASASKLNRPMNLVQELRSKAKQLGQELIAAGARVRETNLQRLQLLEGKLDAFDPTAVLKRGYSLTVDENGKPVVSCQGIRTGDTIQTWLADGQLTSRVESSQANLKLIDHDEEEK